MSSLKYVAKMDYQSRDWEGKEHGTLKRKNTSLFAVVWFRSTPADPVIAIVDVSAGGREGRAQIRRQQDNFELLSKYYLYLMEQ
jgi:hypothetical protein